eukprot:TRINITY_DN6108_c1_g3_i3.p2 TRINITY_DN6108_c1_g3~~TRINITY_DN6108_c1_g3_i3.p2  ORF type:complete len:240 (-),score=80.52 TRINITY_DN6108_c1_g3_i3:219-938(-)
MSSKLLGPRRRNTKEITFDEHARKQYLTGFRKRKAERKKIGHEARTKKQRLQRQEERRLRKAAEDASPTVDDDRQDADDAGTADADSDSDSDSGSDERPTAVTPAKRVYRTAQHVVTTSIEPLEFGSEAGSSSSELQPDIKPDGDAVSQTANKKARHQRQQLAGFPSTVAQQAPAAATSAAVPAATTKTRPTRDQVAMTGTSKKWKKARAERKVFSKRKFQFSDKVAKKLRKERKRSKR